jgi:ribosomal protein L21E
MVSNVSLKVTKKMISILPEHRVQGLTGQVYTLAPLLTATLPHASCSGQVGVLFSMPTSASFYD